MRPSRVPYGARSLLPVVITGSRRRRTGFAGLLNVFAGPGGHAAAAAEPGLVVPALIEPELASRPETTIGGTETDWLCAFCHQRVASERDRFPFNGNDEFTFTNPQGLRFEIITFERTLACHESGAPTKADTWFPGYAWSFCHCDACGQQLGWYYTGLLRFAGLDKARIIRAFVNN